MHATGQDWAEVTEGERTMGRIWARERYDWSTPEMVRAEVRELQRRLRRTLEAIDQGGGRRG